jgi:organic radical activating enzyme
MEGYSDDPLLVVADIVGPTVLAQGTAAGRRCATIRLGGCNLSCSWCDTPFAWDSTRYDLARHLSQWPASQVAATALSCDPPLVVVSGGEPLLQQRQPGWPVLLRSLRGVEVGLETNGTIAPTEETLRGVSWVTVSPKLAHAGDPSWERIKGDVLLTWGRLAHTHDIEFLFVVKDSTDVATVTTLVLVHGLPASRVWVSPEGSTMASVVTRLYEVSEAALAAGFNVAPRIVNPFGGIEAARRAAAELGAVGTPGPAAAAPGLGQGPGGGSQAGQGDVEAARPPVGSRFRRT